MTLWPSNLSQGPPRESLGVTSGAYRGLGRCLALRRGGCSTRALPKEPRQALEASSCATRAVHPNYSRSPRALPTSLFWLPDAPDERDLAREERVEQAGRLLRLDVAVRKGVTQLLERAVAEQELQERQLREVGVEVGTARVRSTLGLDQPAALEAQLERASVEANPQRSGVAGRRRAGCGRSVAGSWGDPVSGAGHGFDQRQRRDVRKRPSPGHLDSLCGLPLRCCRPRRWGGACRWRRRRWRQPTGWPVPTSSPIGRPPPRPRPGCSIRSSPGTAPATAPAPSRSSGRRSVFSVWP